ncbi:MAG: hypothetical protein H6862_00485 [Rhodospirillales bacterium]|nr:hypothetical protein [Rhodospirillales bacterium]
MFGTPRKKPLPGLKPFILKAGVDPKDLDRLQSHWTCNAGDEFAKKIMEDIPSDHVARADITDHLQAHAGGVTRPCRTYG